MLDKSWIRRSFDRAAPNYDRLASLQRLVGERLLAGLPEDFPSGWVLDLGAGTGWCAVELTRRYPERELLLLDISAQMLHQARRRLGEGLSFVVGDIEALPLSTGCAGLIASNLTLQWCVDLERALAEMARVLRPGGVLLFSAFAAGTLEELRQAWRKVDGYSHVNRFASVEDFALALGRAGFSCWRLEQEKIVRRYPSLMALLKEIKGIGAHNVTLGRPRHLLGKNAFKNLLVVYPGEGEIQASFVPVYALATRSA
jgi:malonyl-CoA O-methyltransferase